MTGSLARFLESLFFGFIFVIFPIALSLITVSRIDPLLRREN